jgi:hypothetical protein
MDPISMIISALSAGAISAMQETTTQAIKDSYQGLKALIQRKFAGHPKDNLILEEHGKDPETWEKPLEKALTDAGAADDKQILEAAQKLVDQLKERPQGGKYNVQVSNSQGTVIGDHANVEMDFSDRSSKKRK